MRMVNPHFPIVSHSTARGAAKPRTREVSDAGAMRDVWLMLALAVIVTLADRLFS